MYIKVSDSVLHTTVTYRSIKNVSYVPETDLIGASVPINEFSVDVMTEGEIRRGEACELFDDFNVLWAHYTIVYAEHVDPQTVHVLARSDVAMLDNVKLPATMYDTTAQVVVAEIFGTIPYDLYSSYIGVAIKGYCPEQTARERLAWVCLVLGAYVKSYFVTTTQIVPLDITNALIPLECTYWRPAITYLDYVISFSVTAYGYTVGTPQTTDEWVEADGTTYIVEKTTMTLSPDSVPDGVIGTTMETKDVQLINADNHSAVLSRLATYYFKRTEVDAEIVSIQSLGVVRPGDLVTVYTDEDQMMSGYVQRAEYQFGNMAKARLHIVGAEPREGAMLTVDYVYDNRLLGRKTYVLPVGYSYSIDNPYIDKTENDVRRVYRPTTEAVEGVIDAEGNTETVQYAVALELQNKVLSVISVDSVEVETEDNKSVGVIA